MKLMHEVLRSGCVTKELTFVGHIVNKICRYVRSSGFPYEGKVIREDVEYRPTIPRLFLHVLRLWSMRKKSNLPCESK